jgi:4-carboxymuconolactone decarboxylase
VSDKYAQPERRPAVVTGAHDVLTIQVTAALSSGDLDPEALREVVIFLTHYAGWPDGARLNSLVEETVGKAARGS